MLGGTSCVAGGTGCDGMEWCLTVSVEGGGFILVRTNGEGSSATV